MLAAGYRIVVVEFAAARCGGHFSHPGSGARRLRVVGYSRRQSAKDAFSRRHPSLVRWARVLAHRPLDTGVRRVQALRIRWGKLFDVVNAGENAGR